LRKRHLHQSASTILISKMLLFCYLQSLKKYLAYATIQVGLQVVDVEKASNANYDPQQPGKAIVGGFDTVGASSCGQGWCGQPLDVVAYRSGYVMMTTMQGKMLIIDVNVPAFPTLAGSIKPSENSSYWRAGAVADFSYTGSSGTTRTMDLAITGSWYNNADGNPVYVVDITDPTKPGKIGTVKDMQGSIVTGIVAIDFAISKQAYISSTTGLYVIDIKDPYNPVLLNRIGSETYADGSKVDLGNLRGIAELDGWVYLANLQNGMRVVDLGAFNVNIVNNKGVNVVEVKYGDGKDDVKDCFIRIKVEDAEEECNDQNLQGSIAVKTVEGNVEKDVEVPAGIGYPAKYDLTFEKEADTNNCLGNVKTPDGVKKQVFISNRIKEDLPVSSEKAPIYGGINAIMMTKVSNKTGNESLLDPCKQFFDCCHPLP
jgi:hypothetical protein